MPKIVWDEVIQTTPNGARRNIATGGSTPWFG